MQNKKITYAITGLIAFLVFFAKASFAESVPPLTHALTPLKETVNAPGLHFRNLDGDVVDLKDLQGKVVVVNFWATWCPPCRREMASLEKLHLALKNKNVVVLAVDIGEDSETVFSFMGMINPVPTFHVLLDTDGVSMEKWGIRGLPTTYIIKPGGTIAYKAIGGREFDHPDILNKVAGLATK